MNMFQSSTATSIPEYLALLEPERRLVIEKLHTFIQQTVPDLKPHFASNMIGYGSFPYRNYKKETIEWPVISLASQKNYVSIYVCALEGSEYLAEKYASALGKVSVGKSCIRFKKLEEVNLPELAKVLVKAAEKPGLAKE
jgi:uncharacterized protein YdhG (YjbR/CyaY superfamily)